MDADQFRQLLAATKRKARRPDNYSSGDPLEWITWRRNTTRIITLNGWDNADDLEKAKNEIRVSITGSADVVSADIQPIAGETVAALLDRLQARFCPAAQTQNARVAYDQASQSPTENILAFHGRLRALFTRAHPNLADGIEDNNMLIRKFVLGLIDADVKQWTLSADPATYAAALETAQNRAAVGVVLAASTGGKVPTVNAINDGSSTPSTSSVNTSLRRGGVPQFAGANPTTGGTGGGNCWGCGSPNHMMRDCPRGAARGARGAARGRGGGRGRGSGSGNPRGGWRGRGRGGRGGSGRGRRSLNSIAEDGAEDRDVSEAHGASVNAMGDGSNEDYVDVVTAAVQQVERALDGYSDSE